jgi:hypothetical protein
MYKNEALVIFSCILIIIIGYCFYLLYAEIKNIYKKNKEEFGSRGGNDSKRHKMMRIYKGDEILDPDEDPDDENDDPDSTGGRDPDS